MEVATNALKRATEKLAEICQRGGDEWFNQACAIVTEELKVLELELRGFADKIDRAGHTPDRVAVLERMERAIVANGEKLERLGQELGVDVRRLRP